MRKRTDIAGNENVEKQTRMQFTFIAENQENMNRMPGLVFVSFLCIFKVSFGCELYSLIAPKVLRVESEETLYLNLECDGTYRVDWSLVSYPRRNHEYSEGDSEVDSTRPIPIKIKVETSKLEKNNNGGLQKYVYVNIHWTGGGREGRVKQLIKVNMTNGYLFLTTNQPAYRPSEEVQIVVASLDDSLHLNEKNVEVSIKAPKSLGGYGVWKASRLGSVDQFLRFDYRSIPDEPLVGVWSVEARVEGILMGSTTFFVDKYVTPTFNVKIQMDKHYVLPSDDFIRGKIDAKYSYGENVFGYYYLSCKLFMPNNPNDGIEFFKKPSNFRRRALLREHPQSFEIPTNAILDKLNEEIEDAEEQYTMEKLAHEGATIQIVGVVTGSSESTYESTEVNGIQITTSPYYIDVSPMSKFFSPGVKFVVKAQILDIVTRKPVQKIRVRITVAQNEIEVQSNNDGAIYAEFDAQPTQSVTVTIKTQADGVADEGQATSTTVVQQQTTTHDFGIALKNTESFEVGEQQFITFRTTKRPKMIRYFIVSRGKIVHADTKVVDQQGQGEISSSFQVTFDMIPTSRLIAYFVLNNQLAASSVWFTVKNQCEPIGNNLKFKITGTSEVYPGQSATFTVTGPPNGQVHMWGVDRAAYFVYNESRITQDIMWMKMQEYDVGCSREGGPNAAGVFHEAGLQAITPLTPSNNLPNLNCANDNAAVPKRKKRNIVEIELLKEKAYLENVCVKSATSPKFTMESCEARLKRVRINALYESCVDRFFNECIKYQRNRRYSPVARSTRVNKAFGGAASKLKRINFKEGWIWESFTLGANGEHELRKNAHHSITTYDVGGFSVSNNKAFCIADEMEVAVTKPVFVQIYLPYSIRLHEQAQIRYTIFNYSPNPLNLKARFKLEENLCTKHGIILDWMTLNNEIGIDVLSVSGNGGTKSGTFSILPINIPRSGLTSIEMQVFETNFGNEEIYDEIEKNLRIEQPGKIVHKSNTFNLDDNEPFDFQFAIPDDNVQPDTTICSLTFYANSLGPSIEVDPLTGKLSNLDDYINIPAGCGEQNMKRIGPTVYVHKYRMSRGEVTEAQIHQIQSHLVKAKAIELKWRSDSTRKKAFAVWNTRPPSVWLNAYVLRVFTAGKEFFEFDVEPFCVALNWLKSQQAVDGSFPETYRVHHSEMDGHVDDFPTRTAYVIMAMHETLEICHDSQLHTEVMAKIDKGKEYLNRISEQKRNEMTPYALAMITYALTVVAQDDPATRDWHRRLFMHESVPANAPNQKYFEGTHGRASNIETTAYALLAEVTLNGITEMNQGKAKAIRQWLLSQRNVKGGFISTQDTVVALHALSEHSRIRDLSGFEPPLTNLRVTLTTNDQVTIWTENPQTVRVQQESENMAIKVDVPQDVIGSIVSATVTGVGEGTMSYHCQWREVKHPGRCHYDITINHHYSETRDINQPTKKFLNLEVSVEKAVPNQKDRMSMIEIDIPSGYKANIEDINSLTVEEVVDGIADRYELTDNKVIFYVRGFEENRLIFPIKFEQVTEVKNIQPSSVHVYEYYEPEISCTKFYDVSGINQIRTRGCEGEEICECAEGTCPFCRQRDEQLKNSVYESVQTCTIDNAVLGCFDTNEEICDRSYAHIIQVDQIGLEAPPYMTKFNATISNVLKRGPQGDGENMVAEFIIRQDCSDACDKDPYLREKQLQRNKEETLKYIAPGKTLLIYGKPPERKNNGKFVYFLDDKTVLEMMPSETKCIKKANALRKKQKKGQEPSADLLNDLKLCQQIYDLSKGIRCG